MPTSKVRTLSWRGRTPSGRRASRRGATPESSTIASWRAARHLSRLPAEERHRGGLVARIETGHHVAQALGAHHAAAAMKVASPMSAAQRDSQVERSRAKLSRGRSGPPASEAWHSRRDMGPRC